MAESPVIELNSEKKNTFYQKFDVFKKKLTLFYWWVWYNRKANRGEEVNLVGLRDQYERIVFESWTGLIKWTLLVSLEGLIIWWTLSYMLQIFIFPFHTFFALGVAVWLLTRINFKRWWR